MALKVKWSQVGFRNVSYKLTKPIVPDDTTMTIRPPRRKVRKRSVLQQGVIVRPDKRLDARGKELRPRVVNLWSSPEHLKKTDSDPECVFEESDFRINPHKIEVRLNATHNSVHEVSAPEIIGNFGVLPLQPKESNVPEHHKGYFHAYFHHAFFADMCLF